MNTGRSEKQAEAEQAVVLRVSRARPASEESVAHLWVPGALALSARPRAAPEAGAPSDLPGGGGGGVRQGQPAGGVLSRRPFPSDIPRGTRSSWCQQAILKSQVLRSGVLSLSLFNGRTSQSL